MGKIIIPGVSEDDSVIMAAKSEWNDQAYLRDLHQLFLQSVQVGAAKDYHYNNDLAYVVAGSPIWNEKDTFDDFVKDALIMLDVRMDELNKIKREMTPILAPLADTLRHPELKLNPVIGKTRTPEHVEVMEFAIRKSIEACHKYLNGKLELTDVKVM